MTAIPNIEAPSVLAIEGFTRKAVRDVFKAMLGIDVENVEASPLPSDPAGQIIGSVGFIGEATGIIYLFAGAELGKTVACRMLGLSDSEVDAAMVNDAFGELCNMVVGSVKSRLCDGGLHCVLTVPSIVRGNNLRIEICNETQRITLGFRSGEQRLIAEVTVKIL